LENVLKIEVYGLRKNLHKQMEKLLEEHKKAFEKQEENLIKENYCTF
jgi:hypothetical protein